MTDLKKKILEKQLSIIERTDIPVEFKRDILDALRKSYYQISLAESLIHEVEILNEMSNDWCKGLSKINSVWAWSP